MGIGIQALQLTFSLWQDGSFKESSSIIEIGSQDIHAKDDIVASKIQKLTGKRPSSGKVTAKMLYQSLGIKNYKCIDADGMNDALIFDLNTNIRETTGFSEQFDIVTNHGTTEHCFDQMNAFKNIHELCKQSGIMIHGLPFQGYLNHGFYNYHPKFYHDLALSNGYSMMGMYLNIHSTLGDITPYSDELMNYIHTPPGTDMLLFVVLRKNGSKDFVTPFDKKYSEQLLVDDNYNRGNKQFFPGARDEDTDISTMRTRHVARVLLGRIIKTVKNTFS